MPHQLDAIDRLVLEKRKIIAMEMGCGKTAVGINYIESCPDITAALIIVQSNKMSDWLRDYKACFPDTSIEIWKPDKLQMPDDVRHMVKKPKVDADKPKKPSKKKPPKPIPKVWITSYTMLTRSKYAYQVLERQYDVVVLDEAHSLKGADAKCVQKIVPVIATIPRVALLTGTPMMNRPSELYNLLYMIDPVEFHSRRKFTKQYCDGKFNSWGAWEEKGAKNIEELNTVLNKYMIRALKSEVMPDLPPKTRSIQKFTGSTPELLECKDKWLDLIKKLSDATGLKKKQLSRQVETLTSEYWRLTGRVKIPIIVPWIIKECTEEHPTAKFMIWCWHICNAELLYTELTNAGIASILVTGQNTDALTRSDAFNPIRDPESPIRVCICTIQAGGTGYTIVPGPSRVIFAELYYVPFLLEQTEDRVHRKGTIHPIHVTYCALSGSYDDPLLAKIDYKKKLFDKIVGLT